MIRLLVLCLTFASMVGVAGAHHKAGHNPPGHTKHKKGWVALESVAPAREVSPWTGEIVIRAVGADAALGEHSIPVRDLADLDWRVYRDTVFDFSVEIPFALFEPAPEGGRGLRLYEIGGGPARLDVYGAENAQGLSPEEFVAMLYEGEPIGEVTYRAGGKNWFVLSGYYAVEAPSDDQMIFYTKFMFSSDGKRISAFEIGYPKQDKALFDPIVERLEQTLSPPR